MICKPNKDQKYDVWLHWNLTAQCNLNCEYCFGKIPVNKKNINSIDIEKLMRTLKKSGKTFRISFTGGEPFLIKNIVEVCYNITQSHFISFNTNLLLPSVINFAKIINPEKVLFIQASFHINELLEKGLLDKYIENFLLLKEKKFNIIAEAVAYPNDYLLLKKYEKLLLEKGIKLFYAPFIGRNNDKNYPKDYENEEIEKWNFPKERINYHYQKGELCNAGKSAAVIYSNGDIYPCFQIKEKIGNIYQQIDFFENIKVCPAKFCGCPLNKYDPTLFNKNL